MFSHIMLGVNDLKTALEFYDAVMATLGYARQSTGQTFAGYGAKDDIETGVNCLWIGIPFNGAAATSGNGTNIAFLARNRRAVDLFHKTAIALGGINEGNPGIRPEAHANFYAAYVRDPDGNKLVAVCHQL